MVIRLRNQKNPEQVLLLTHQAWWELLDLAELYGWSPLGPLMAGEWSVLDLGPDEGYLPGGSTRFVEEAVEANQVILLEDALNLADALERAFMEYEPVRVPASYYLFEPSDLNLSRRPGIGAMMALIEFCRAGRFSVERVQFLTRT
jgi:hypothetical protein